MKESIALSEREAEREGGKVRSYPPQDYIIKKAMKARKPPQAFREEDKLILAHALRDFKKKKVPVSTKKALFEWLEKKVCALPPAELLEIDV